MVMTRYHCNLHAVCICNRFDSRKHFLFHHHLWHIFLDTTMGRSASSSKWHQSFVLYTAQAGCKKRIPTSGLVQRMRYGPYLVTPQTSLEKCKRSWYFRATIGKEKVVHMYINIAPSTSSTARYSQQKCAVTYSSRISVFRVLNALLELSPLPPSEVDDMRVWNSTEHFY